MTRMVRQRRSVHENPRLLHLHRRTWLTMILQLIHTRRHLITILRLRTAMPVCLQLPHPSMHHMDITRHMVTIVPTLRLILHRLLLHHQFKRLRLPQHLLPQRIHFHLRLTLLLSTQLTLQKHLLLRNQLAIHIMDTPHILPGHNHTVLMYHRRMGSILVTPHRMDVMPRMWWQKRIVMKTDPLVLDGNSSLFALGVFDRCTLAFWCSTRTFIRVLF